MISCSGFLAPIQYTGDLNNPKAHPYVHSTREQAAAACKAAGYKGLCSKAQGYRSERCSAGWYSDFEGYWISKAEPNCRNHCGWHGNMGAYCGTTDI